MKWDDRVRHGVMLGLVIVVIAVLVYIRSAITPLVIGALIAYVLTPVVGWIERGTKVSRNWAVNIVFWLSLGVFISLPILIWPTLFEEISTLVTDLRDLYGLVQDYVAQPVVGCSSDYPAHELAQQHRWHDLQRREPDDQQDGGEGGAVAHAKGGVHVLECEGEAGYADEETDGQFHPVYTRADVPQSR